MPRQFAYRGDRLAFSIGIIVLSVLAAILIVGFAGSVTSLIPLYTVGVFVAFTLSQAGMVRHWWRRRMADPGWRRRAALNAIGAIATGVVAAVVGFAKFALGAWMVLILIPVLIAIMWSIHRHYGRVRDALTVDAHDALRAVARPRVIVPVSRVDRATLSALSFARAIATDAIAVHISEGPEEAAEMRRRWERLGTDMQLAIVESPYRVLVAPLLAYVDALERLDPARPVTVVLSEFVPRRFWDYFLHNQTALRLKVRLFFRRNTVVIDVPYHLDDAYRD
jgi:hypothetical protein